MRIFKNNFILIAILTILFIFINTIYCNQLKDIKFVRPMCCVYNSNDNSYFISTKGNSDGYKIITTINMYEDEEYIKGKVYRYNSKDTIKSEIFLNADDNNFKMLINDDILYICGLDLILSHNLLGERKIRKPNRKKIAPTKRKNRYEKHELNNVISFTSYKPNKLIIIDDKNQIIEFNQNSLKYEVLYKLDSIYSPTDIYFSERGNLIFVSTNNFENSLLKIELTEESIEKVTPDLKVPIKSMTPYSNNEILVNSSIYGTIYKVNLQTGAYEKVFEELYDTGYISYIKEKDTLLVPMVSDGYIKMLRLE